MQRVRKLDQRERIEDLQFDLQIVLPCRLQFRLLASIAENNQQYPKNSLYISELTVLESRQKERIGRSLLEQFLLMNNTVGFLTLDGAMRYSVQTNSARWNRHVRELYESFGFKKRATKDYANRTDIVLSVCVDQLIY